MSDTQPLIPLAQLAIDAHGGLARWRALRHASAHIVGGGMLWAAKGFPEFAAPATVTVSLHEQRHSHEPFLASGQRSVFTPGRVAVETPDGLVLQSRLAPRAAFAGHTLESPWDELHLAYFTGYAMSTYLKVPFIFAEPGVVCEELAPWQENGETWRRLQVTFPPNIATHCAVQVFYFGDDGLLRRHDYDVDVSKGARGAHYVYGYQAFDGIMVPTKRRVYAPDIDNRPMPEPLVVSVELSAIRFW